MAVVSNLRHVTPWIWSTLFLENPCRKGPEMVTKLAIWRPFRGFSRVGIPHHSTVSHFCVAHRCRRCRCETPRRHIKKTRVRAGWVGMGDVEKDDSLKSGYRTRYHIIAHHQFNIIKSTVTYQAFWCNINIARISKWHSTCVQT